MDLKELRYFRAIAEWGTFSKAAANLRVAQPALSRHMQKLEHSLGVELLHRTSKGIVLTPAGAALLERTIRLERDIAETCREVSNFAQGLTGSIHVAVQYPISTRLMPPLVKAYREIHPNVAIHVVEGYSCDIAASLLSERLDVAIFDPPTHEHADLTSLPLWVDHLALYGSAGTASLPMFSGKSVSLKEAATLPIIVPSRTSSLRRLIDSAFARQHLELRPVLEADGQLLNLEMVKAGLGYTIFPKGTFSSIADRGEVFSRLLTPSILRTTALVTRTALLADRKVAPFIDLVKRMVPSVVRGSPDGTTRFYVGEEARLDASRLHFARPL